MTMTNSTTIRLRASLQQVRQGLFAAALFSGLGAASATAQQIWVVDQIYSIGWWQVSPHFNQLWATTCPNEYSWQPGEGRTPGWIVNPDLQQPKFGKGSGPDTIHVPFYPRSKIMSKCPKAVEGSINVPDTVAWKGITGKITVNAEYLISGETMRDGYAKKLLNTKSNPYVFYTIDSIAGVTYVGDTIVATSWGVLTVRNIPRPNTGQVKSFRDRGGRRVLAKLHIPAARLWEEFGISKFALMGAGTGIWKDFFMGVDLLMMPKDAAELSDTTTITPPPRPSPSK